MLISPNKSGKYLILFFSSIKNIKKISEMYFFFFKNSLISDLFYQKNARKTKKLGSKSFLKMEGFIIPSVLSYQKRALKKTFLLQKKNFFWSYFSSFTIFFYSYKEQK